MSRRAAGSCQARSAIASPPMHTVEPIACQRHLFELPDHVSYLDAAAWTPLPRPVRSSGEADILSKVRPWAYSRGEDTVWAGGRRSGRHRHRRFHQPCHRRAQPGASGGALVLDATQAVGVIPLDVSRLRPDLLAFPAYRWVFGPYNPAFPYATPHRQHGLPMEENIGNRSHSARAATTRVSATTQWRCPWPQPEWNWSRDGACRLSRRGCAS